jgi:hypothetical protein
MQCRLTSLGKRKCNQSCPSSFCSAVLESVLNSLTFDLAVFLH